MLIIASLALAAAVHGQGNLTSDVLYKSGEKSADQGLTLKGWGSGSISQTDETSYAGTYSIQVSTRNYFQGGILDWNTGQDLSGKYEDKNNLFKITYKTADSSQRGFGGNRGGGFPGGPTGGPPRGGGLAGAGGGGPIGGPGGQRGGFPGGPGGPGGAGGQRGGFPGGPGGGFPGAPGGGGLQGGPGGGFRGGPGGNNVTEQPEPLRTIRLIVTTTDNKRSEAFIPVDTSSSTDNGWKIVSVPLQAISGFDRTNKIVKDLAFSGDSTATIYIGDLRVVNDSTPISGSIENAQDLNLALGDSVTFSAYGSGGASILKYSWDFGTSPTPEEDAVGRSVTRKFRKPGNYKVTLSISDYYGLKAPFTTSVNVKVNQ